MHDGVAQALSYLNLKAGAVTKALAAQDVAKAQAGIQDIRDVVRSTYEDIRESLDQLTGGGLPPSDGHPDDLRGHHGLSIMIERARSLGGTRRFVPIRGAGPRSTFPYPGRR